MCFNKNMNLNLEGLKKLNIEDVIDAANKTFIAMKNPYESVEKVFPQALEKFRSGMPCSYLGVKNKKQVPRELIARMEKEGSYVLHTIDRASLGGRAVDVRMINPLSGRPMTGSSSGTAVNVLLGINDVGIGTDGGGSVLAPAMSLNLFGFISPLIESAYMEQFRSTSTDQISFFPSLGFITREWDEMAHVVNFVLNLEEASDAVIREVDSGVDVLGPRKDLIAYLQEILPTCDVLVSHEGPIDLHGFGDTVLGHLGEATSALQRAGNKGLIRVANMVGATAIVVPKKEFGCATVLLCESSETKIAKMMAYAEKLALPQDALVKRYFQDVKNYFGDEY